MATRRAYLRGAATAGGLGTLGLFAGCSSGSDGGGGTTGAGSDAPTVGVLTTLSRDVGKATRRGVELAAAAVDEAGTLDGGLSVKSVATEANASTAVEAYNTLVNRQGADVTLGTFAAPPASAVMPELASSGTIHLTVGATSPELPAQVAEEYERFKPWFRVAPLNGELFVVDMLGFAERFVVEEQGWESVAIFREDAAWTGGIAGALKREFPKIGLSIEDEVVFPLSETNYRPYLDRIREAGVDVVFGLVGGAGKAPLLSYEEASVDVPMVGDVVAAQSPQYLADINAESSNVIGRTFSTWGATLSERAQAFVEEYESTYDSRPTKPTWAAFGAYAGTRMYARALAEGDGSLDGTVTALENTEFALNQTYSFYEPGETEPATGNAYPHDVKFGPEFYQPTWSQWRDGEQVTIYPERFANAEFRGV